MMFASTAPSNAPRAHDANPLLVNLRIYRDDWTPRNALDSITDMDGDSDGWELTPEQAEHATRVLTRWLAIFDPESTPTGE